MSELIELAMPADELDVLQPQASEIDDPLAGIPTELLDRVGDFDRDTAGGCG